MCLYYAFIKLHFLYERCYIYKVIVIIIIYSRQEMRVREVYLRSPIGLKPGTLQFIDSVLKDRFTIFSVS